MKVFTGNCEKSNQILTKDYLIDFDRALCNAEETLSRLEKTINEKMK